MSHDPCIALTRDGLSLSRLVFGAWRLLDDAVRRDADAVARLIGTAVDLGLTSFSLRRPSLPCRAFLPVSYSDGEKDAVIAAFANHRRCNKSAEVATAGT